MVTTRSRPADIRARVGVALLGFVLLASSAPAAWAAAPTGACCFRDGSCEELADFQCTDAGGDFIGTGMTCATVNCNAPVAAPLLSAAGLIAAASALGGIGLLRALARRRS